MSRTAPFSGRLAVQQRVLPAYRVPFFDQLAVRCAGGLSLFAGLPRRGEAILTAAETTIARFAPARNRHLLAGAAYLCIQPKILDWLTAWDPQALILEANPRYWSNRRAIAWMRARRQPVIGWGLGAPRGRFLWRGFLRQFDALIAYSTLGAEQYRAAGFPAERVYVAPNAVVEAPPTLHARLIRPSGPPTVLFVGRLQERKRLDLLLQACGQLTPRPELVIVGDGPARPQLERLAQRVYPLTRWKGSVQGEALDRLFRQADLFVLPGTGGLAVQQAMAHGLPVVVADGDGTQRDLVSGDNGWLVPPGNLAALTEALRSAFSNPDRLREMGAASHRIVADRINIQAMVDTFLRALEDVQPW
ncbi:MAG: glycosyltransferase family 4 protein [Anaerolineales bacterium]